MDTRYDFGPETGDHRFNNAHIAEDQAALNGVHRIGADGFRRPHQIDLRQFRGAAKQRVGGNANARGDRAAQIFVIA